MLEQGKLLNFQKSSTQSGETFRWNEKSIGTQKELFLIIIKTPDIGKGYNLLASLGPFLLPSTPSTPSAPLFPLTQTPRSGLPDCMSNMMGST